VPKRDDDVSDCIAAGPLEEGCPEADPELALALEEAMSLLTREVRLGQACPNCGSTDTVHVSVGDPDGASLPCKGWTIVLPPDVFASSCRCESCDHWWEAGVA
jgi:hypothetical protein